MNSNKTLFNTLWKFILIPLLALVTIFVTDAKVVIKAPAVPTLSLKCSSKGGSSSSSNSSNNNSSANENHSWAIYCNGHKTVLSYAGVNKYGSSLTKIWVDENDNGIEETDDETLTDDLSDVYIYGGCENECLMKDVDITMTGGNVKGIWGGGYAGKTSANITGNVSITISGGKVNYVDGGGETNSNLSLNESKAKVTGTVDILLYNCEFTGLKYINDNGTDNMTGSDVRVRDFSTHTVKVSYKDWGKSSVGNKYIIQTGDGELSINWSGETAVIPAGVDMTVNKLFATIGSSVNCLGYIRMAQCSNDPSIYDNQAIWSGNAVVENHVASTNVPNKDNYTSDYHYVTCSRCLRLTTAEHQFKAVDSGTDVTDPAQSVHHMICTKCNYYYDEPCQDYSGYTSVGDGTHNLTCNLCGHVFRNDSCTAESSTDLNSTKHTSVCQICKGSYTEPHAWTNESYPTCTKCNSKNHTHEYSNGVCKTCGYEHPSYLHNYSTSTVDGTSVQYCTICGKGCTHTLTIGGKEYSKLYFDKEYSSTRDGHYDKCSICGAIVRDEKNSDHWTTIDVETGEVYCTICDFRCNHEDSLTTTTTTSTRYQTTPAQSYKYTVTHDELSCKKCGLQIAAVISHNGNKYYMKSLEDAFDFSVVNMLDGATITLNRDVVMNGSCIQDLKGLTLTLDLNDCDISYPLSGGNQNNVFYFSNGQVTVCSSKSNTSRYAVISNGESYFETIRVGDSCTVSLNRVHLSNLSLGSGNMNIGNIEVDNLMHTDEDTCTYKLTGEIRIFNLFSCYASDFPTGYVVKRSYYTYNQVIANHTYKNSDGTDWFIDGPSRSSYLITLSRCTSHHLTTGTSEGSKTHSGICEYCGAKQTGWDHRMTALGHCKNTESHYLACVICGYEGEEEEHLFNPNGDHSCYNSLCGQLPAVGLKHYGNSDTEYYGSFESAWEQTNNPGRLDTLILLQDITLSSPLTIASDTTAVPYIFIKGNGHTLSYTGSGNPVIYPVIEGQEDNELQFCLGTKCTSNWNVMIEAGCLFNEDKTEVISCTHPDEAQTYTCDTVMTTDESGATTVSYLATHTQYCSLCRASYFDAHNYNSTSRCQYCNAERVIVATAEANGEQIGQYGTLTEAFDSAAVYSANNSVKVTIRVNQNLDVFRKEGDYNVGIITLNNKDADIELYANDANGNPYTVIGQYSNCSLFAVYHGSLTICSGNYQGGLNAVICYRDINYYQDAKVQLKGGTFNKGYTTYSTSNIDGINATSWTYRDDNNYTCAKSYGVASMITPGYMLQASGSNYEYSDSRYSALWNYSVQEGDLVGCDYPWNLSSASGTIVACDHEGLDTATWVAADTVGCLDGGNLEYRQCPKCGAFECVTDTTSRSTILTNRAGAFIDAYGHNYVDGVCTRCGNQQITCRLYFATTWGSKYYDNVGYDNIFDAFSNNNNDLSTGGGTSIITLYDDVDLTYSEEELPQITSRQHLYIDLNGHNLSLGDNTLDFYGYSSLSYNPADCGSLTIYDSQKAGKTFTGNISVRKVWPVTIQDVSVVIPTSYDVPNATSLKGAAGITFCNGAETTLGSIDMEEGCYLSGYNQSKIRFKGYYDETTGVYPFDQNASLPSAFHQLTCNSTLNGDEVTDCHIQYDIELQKAESESSNVSSDMSDMSYDYGDSDDDEEEEEVNYDTLTVINVLLPNDSAAGYGYHWKATYSAGTIAHTYAGTPVDLGQKHSRFCSVCGAYISDDHNYTLYDCTICGHAAAAVTYIGKEMQAYTTIEEAITAAQGKEATVKLMQDCDYEENHNTILSDSTVLTLDLNDHTLTFNDADFGLQLDNARLTIEPGTDHAGEIDNAGNYVITVTDNPLNYLSITDGTYNSDSAAISIEGDNAQIYLHKGYFSGIECISDNRTVTDLLASTGMYIDKQVVRSNMRYNLGTTSLNTYMETGLDEAVDKTNSTLQKNLQSAVCAGGYVQLISEDDMSTYIQVSTAENGYEVKPYLSVRIEDDYFSTTIDNSLIGGECTFRLPVPDENKSGILTVCRQDNDSTLSEVADCQVYCNDTIGKYVEVTTSTFGTFVFKAPSQYILTDAETYNNAYSTVFGTLQYQRNFTNLGHWEPLYIPMSIMPTADYDIAEIYTFGYMEDSNEDGVINEDDEMVMIVDKLDNASATEANVPYLIRSNASEVTIDAATKTLNAAEEFEGACSTARTKYSIKGTYKEVYIGNDLDVYTLNDDKLQIFYEDVVEPQRWYMQISSKKGGYNVEVEQANAAGIRIFTIGEDLDEETALQILHGKQVDIYQNGVRYTLDGRKATQLERGIQIRSGKKEMK